MQLARTLLRGGMLAAVASLCAGHALAQEGERQSLRAGRLTGAAMAPVQQSAGSMAPVLQSMGAVSRTELSLDGVMSEAAWATADSITNLVTIEPEEGGTPEGRTVVKVLVSPDFIIIGARCYDKDPSGIVSYSRARDSDLEQEDHIMLLLDTFQDERSGYIFAVNPSGARYDGIVAGQGNDVNANWDGVWEARTARDAEGWSVEIRIPIKSISFDKKLTSWGFNIQRRVQRLQETSRWSGASQDYEIYQSSRAGQLTELSQFNLGLGLSIRPAITGSARRTSPEAKLQQTGDVSLDVTQRLGANLLASLTVNTDFAETEVDARQTNLTRFDVLFPEKRSFFLEGSDIFEFGAGLDAANLVPFFSRRIGLIEPESGESDKIPITAGVKLNGRAGNTNLGALVMRTGSLDSLGVPQSTMGVVRLKQNVLEESSVGMIATFGDPLGRRRSWLGGVDATYRTSNFLGDKNFLIGAWGMRNERDSLEGNKDAYGFMIDYPNDLWAFALTSITIGDGVQPSLGFAPRTGVRVWDVGIDFNPRPSGFVRQMFHELGIELFTDLGNQWVSYEAKINPLDWQLESGDRVTFKILPQGDRPPEEFELFGSPETTVDITAGSYQWTRYEATGELAGKRRISGSLTYGFGRFYDGHLKTISGTMAFKPLAVLALELSGERNQGELPNGTFTQYLYGTRVEVKPSADFQMSSFAQYDNESRSLGTNTRLRWTFHPLGDLFVSYNHNLLRSLGDRQGLSLESNQLLIKLQYATRL